MIHGRDMQVSGEVNTPDFPLPPLVLSGVGARLVAKETKAQLKTGVVQIQRVLKPRWGQNDSTKMSAMLSPDAPNSGWHSQPSIGVSL